MTGVETPELAPDILLDKTRFLVGVVMLMILVLRQVRFIPGAWVQDVRLGPRIQSMTM